jgi:phosphoribosylformimino-5-aminoimidazole carboxamide ribotide isomerase
VIEPAPRALTLFPAIDLRRGRCVRLEQGALERETEYDTDPFRVADSFVRAGAEWIHVVDLDAAFGDGTNRDLISELAGRVPVPIQTGGGLRSEGDLEQVLGGSVARAVIGTAAIEQPDLVKRAIAQWGPSRIAVGIDARDRTPAVRGWREETGGDLFDLGRRLVDLGAQTIIYTDISRDGMLAGPNLPMSVELAERTGAGVIVSGGVGAIEDLDAVRRAAPTRGDLVGVIVGKAIYEGRIDVAEAVRRLGGGNRERR